MKKKKRNYEQKKKRAPPPPPPKSKKGGGGGWDAYLNGASKALMQKFFTYIIPRHKEKI